MVRALVCGGRDFGRWPMKFDEYGFEVIDKDHPVYPRRKAEYDFGITILYLLLCEDAVGTEANATWMPPADLTVIHGGATGADAIADEWAVVNWVNFEEYKADWARWGNRAGMIRNRTMLVQGKPDLVIAFPGGKGTANMVSIARAKGVTVIEVPYSDKLKGAV